MLWEASAAQVLWEASAAQVLWEASTAQVLQGLSAPQQEQCPGHQTGQRLLVPLGSQLPPLLAVRAGLKQPLVVPQ